jgi:purine-nucleoside phosphorylase
MSVDELLMPDDAGVVRAAGAPAPRVAVVAGSGLGTIGELVEDAVRIPYSDLPSMSALPSVAGQQAELVCGTLNGCPVVVFSGRVHMYQGASAREAAFTARLAATLGASTLVLTNAAGGIAKSMLPGTIMLIRDHINLTARNPLEGWSGPDGGTPFVPMNQAYDADLRELAFDVAREHGMDLEQGVYACLLGPNYETPAEVAMLSTLGADAVGMSTVAETIAARALGLKVLGLSVITNSAAHEGISHSEVLAMGDQASARLQTLVAGILLRLWRLT